MELFFFISDTAAVTAPRITNFTAQLGISRSFHSNIVLGRRPSALRTTSFTAQLGISDSFFGNIVLGLQPTGVLSDVSEVLVLTETAYAQRLFTAQIGIHASYLTNIQLGRKARFYRTNNIAETIIINQVVSASPSYQSNVTENLIIVEIARVPSTIDEIMHDAFTLYQTVTTSSTFNRTVSEALVLVEEAENREPVIITLTVSESLAFVENRSASMRYSRTTTDTLVMVEPITRGYSPLEPILEDLEFAEDLLCEKYKEGNVSEALVIAETVISINTHPSNISEQLVITETLGHQAIYNLTVSEHLPLRGGIVKTLRANNGSNNNTYSINEAEVVKVPKKCYVSLDALDTNTSIILPCPEMGDSEKNLNTQVVKRSMTNVVYSYVRKNELQQLNYSFVVGRPIAYDLQNFIELNIDKLINLTNWKGEIWKVYITNNPVEFVSKSRYENEGEKWTVDLEFQGLRLL